MGRECGEAEFSRAFRWRLSLRARSYGVGIVAAAWLEYALSSLLASTAVTT